MTKLMFFKRIWLWVGNKQIFWQMFRRKFQVGKKVPNRGINYMKETINSTWFNSLWFEKEKLVRCFDPKPWHEVSMQSLDTKPRHKALTRSFDTKDWPFCWPSTFEIRQKWRENPQKVISGPNVVKITQMWSISPNFPRKKFVLSFSAKFCLRRKFLSLVFVRATDLHETPLHSPKDVKWRDVRKMGPIW